MNCRELVTFLADYLDGSLPAAERVLFETHLADCPDCVHYLATYQATIRLAREACHEEAEAALGDVPEELVQAVQAMLSRQRS